MLMSLESEHEHTSCPDIADQGIIEYPIGGSQLPPLKSALDSPKTPLSNP